MIGQIIASNDMCYKQKSPSGAIHNFTATKNSIGTKNSRFNLLYRNGHLQVVFLKLKFCFTDMLIRVATMVISRITELNINTEHDHPLTNTETETARLAVIGITTESRCY